MSKKEISFKDKNELMPAVIQDDDTGKVLMLGYMNAEAFNKTLKEKKVTFYSRSKQRLWTKGETSGNFLNVKDYLLDCDKDTILFKVNPAGPVCHTGADTCFEEKNDDSIAFINKLQEIIKDRKLNPTDKSYTSSLFQKGINKIAQKVGEEAVELIIEAKDNNSNLFKEEAADLIFHLLVLFEEKKIDLKEIVEVLKSRYAG